MPTPENKGLYSHEVQREGGEDVVYENYADVMERTIDVLIENPNISRIVFTQQKNYNYDFKETGMLLEIAQLYVFLIKQERILSQEKLVVSSQRFFSQRYNQIFTFLYFLKRDPVAAHAELKKLLIEANIFFEKIGADARIDQKNYIALLEKIMRMLEDTRLIQAAAPYLET